MTRPLSRQPSRSAGRQAGHGWVAGSDAAIGLRHPGVVIALTGGVPEVHAAVCEPVRVQ